MTDLKSGLAELANPPSVEPDLDEMKDAIEKEVAPTEKEKNKKLLDNPRSKAEYEFKIDYSDPRGKQYAGRFTNKVLTIGQQQMVGIMRSRLAGGMPLESLDALTIEVNLMVAHMTYSLTEKPKWAENLTALTDIALVQMIYLEVASHEATFHGRDPLTN